MDMDIYNHEPRRIMCVNNSTNVIHGETAYLLEIGKIYNLVLVDVHNWYTEVYIKEIPFTPFNSVLFVEVE